jgi:FHA domain
MKNIIEQIKKGFGFAEQPVTLNNTGEESEKPVPVKPVQKSFSLPAANARREEVIGFIVKALEPYIDEKTQPIAGIRLYLKMSDAVDEQVTRVALHLDSPTVFQKEHLERKLSNYFIPLETYWTFECQLVKQDFPEHIFVRGDLGLEVLHRGQALAGPYISARLKILSGKAEQEEYVLNGKDKLRFHIGRSRSPQLSTGKMQYNDIVFPGKDDPSFNESVYAANLHVSRNHAFIQFNPQMNKFYLYADNGGLPDNGNKTRIHTSNGEGKLIAMPGVGHELHHGDQIELGGKVLMLFLLEEA